MKLWGSGGTASHNLNPPSAFQLKKTRINRLDRCDNPCPDENQTLVAQSTFAELELQSSAHAYGGKESSQTVFCKGVIQR